MGAVGAGCAGILACAIRLNHTPALFDGNMKFSPRVVMQVIDPAYCRGSVQQAVLTEPPP